MNNNIKLMLVFSKLYYTFLDRLGKNIESLGMTDSAYLMLAHLNEVNKAKTQKLGEIALVTSGTITHTVNKLLKEGYVVKVQDKADKRVFWIEITDLGREAFIEVDIEHMKFLDGLLEDFTDEEKIDFAEQIKYFGKKIADK